MNFIINIEKIKTTLVVVLFMITILLLYFLWGSNTLSKNFFEPNDNQLVTNEIDVQKFIKPFRVQINFGGSNYTVLYSGIDELLNQYIESIKPKEEENIKIEEISKDKWDEILSMKSVRFDYDYNVPFVALKGILGTTKIPGDAIIETVSQAVYSKADVKSHFIYDGKNDRYFRIIFEHEHTEILDSISKIEEKDYDIYHPIKKYFGKDNNNLMPFKLKNNMEVVQCEQEIQSYESDTINILAEIFFRESFDFVRKIIEHNGTVIYMYGYGEKILTVSDKGYLEYKEEIDIDNHENSDYTEALSIALSYVSNHGNWQTLKGTEIYPYLKESRKVTRVNQKGYKFVFGYRINGYPVYYEKDEAIEVEVIGKQVVYYKRFILNQKDTLQYLTNDNDEDIKDKIIPTNIILTNNYETLKEIFIQNGYDFSDQTYEQILNEMVSMIQRVDIGYYLSDKTQETSNLNLIPSWVFTTDKFKIYFGIKSGMYLGWNT